MARAPVFHLSCYVTLSLAAVCLGFAELFFLSWMPWFVAVIGVLFGLAWKYEGRWQLSDPGANSIGLVIAFGMLGWVVLQIPRSEADLLAAGVPWPAGLLPHLGPLLMILTAVKLFRPKKVPDFWSLQLLGVMMVTLASVLAGEMNHGFWVFLYLVSLIWCLVHFERMQRTWAGLSDERRRQSALFAADGIASRVGWRESATGLRAALLWSIAIAGLGVGLFVMAPRHASIQWIPHKLSVAASSRMSAGLDAGMDLNRVGKVELSDEVAFEVITQDAEGRTVDLSSSIYWRGETLDYYQNGRWYSGSQTSDLWPEMPGLRERPNEAVRMRILSVPGLFGSPHPTTRPADVPADKTYLTIRALPSMAGSLVAAEPVDIDAGIGRSPRIGERASRSGIFQYLDGADSIAPSPQTRRALYSYGQVVDLSASAATQRARRIQKSYLQSFLLQPPPEALVRWSRDLLLRQSGLTEGERSVDDDNRVAPQHHAKVARALTAHFAESGEYLYTLNLRRTDKTLDPNVDFLFHVKEGHCERYASGLALTLRGLGIPCRIVHGFRGVEKTDDHLYLVRFNQAHSWVQALVPRQDGGSDWLLLDPTPSMEAPLNRWQAFVEWFGAGLRSAQIAFRNGILDYGSDAQMAKLRSWWVALRTFSENSPIDPLLAIGGIAFAAVAWRFGKRPLRKWWNARQTARLQRERLPWLADALASIDAKTGRSPTSSQTLLEFAAALGVGPAAALASAFSSVVRHANRVRFGLQPLSADDRRDIERSLNDLRCAASLVGQAF